MRNPFREAKIVLLPVSVTLTAIATLVACALIGFESSIIMWIFFVAMSFCVNVYVVQVKVKM